MGSDGTEELRMLLRAGRNAEAAARADAVAASSDLRVAAYALLQKAAALLNMGRIRESAAVIDAADQAVRRYGDPVSEAQMHALAAFIPFVENSLDRCAAHLVQGARALHPGLPDTVDLVDAYNDLAFVHSLVGFHERADTLRTQALASAGRLGLFLPNIVKPEIQVRHAVYLDHCGRTAQARSVLSAVAHEAADLARRYGPDTLPPALRIYSWYAEVRLAALGDVTRPVVGLTGRDEIEETPETCLLLAFGDVCQAIASGRPDRALAQLDTVDVDARLIGVGEPYRLRALAYTAAGDHRAAHEADRTAFAATAEVSDRARQLFVDAVGIRLDHDELRQTAARYADEANTDALTGLPNRRHFDRYARSAPMVGQAAVGVVDLDGFHNVNSVHGHLTGDIVLQRVAGVMSRMVRRRDLLARVGGDEFALVLPDTTLDEAIELGRRMVAAVAGEDWESFVPGTPVGITVGWARLSAGGDVRMAFDEADRAMLSCKNARPGRLRTAHR
ncbi:hypothetical protein GCM10027290_21500 [Micromonospora sonneratiae]|uniref:GGDEF domain-containing protein n=1 Tax=Micromonospora sonneratiae TaxID=1184706 RepID=A0ABW3YFA3_9ACTN